MDIKCPDKSTVFRNRDEILARIREKHLRRVGDSDGDVFFISDAYPGVWLEHTYDPVCFAEYDPAGARIARNQIGLFVKHQTAEGQLPAYVWQNKVGYGQIQECVSFGRMCLKTWVLNGKDAAYLRTLYDACVAWDGWLVAKRMPHATGLIEMFCGYDTGHDNSGRLVDMKYQQEICEDGGVMPTDDPVLPILASDMNAVFYGDRCALAEMAALLGRPEEAAAWRAKADDVRRKMDEWMWDEEDAFYYDVALNGEKRRMKTIAITNVLCEGVADCARAEEIYARHLRNPQEFWTPYPFPAVAINEPLWKMNRPGNSWGYFSQGLTAQRSLLWMEGLGKTADMEEIMRRWIAAWCASPLRFGQELDPLTGAPSNCSEWYSACMLYYLHAVRRLYE